ncbi:MAG: hypothetical protein HY211_00055 [Candidatus Omnitrophica bacterium]|nr:hypothetical protein [Candidatus Omnitrophota bacterium]
MSWKNIVGNEPAVRLLKGQLNSGRVAHTYLFVGQRGIGKRTLALEFAKALQCESGKGDACDSEITSGAASSSRSHDVCETCRQIGQGRYPDLRIVSSESETGQLGIDQVRSLAGWLSLTPYQARWKVGLIDGADRLTEEGAHAALKLLEEPPGKSVLLLTAAALQRLPATLISRCHLVRCVPQGIERVTGFLKEEERPEPAGRLEPASRIESTTQRLQVVRPPLAAATLAQMLATWSGGRLGLALEFHRGERLAVKNGVLNQLLAACRQRTPEIPLGTAPRQEVEEALEWLAAWWRDLLLLALKADPAWVIHQDRLQELQKTGDSGSVEEFLQRIEWTYRAQEAIQRNASPRIALATLFCRA